MTTIFAVTSLRLNGLQRKKLLDAVEKAANAVLDDVNLYFFPYSTEFAAGRAINQMNYFTFLPETVTLQMRAELVKLLTEATVRMVPQSDPENVFVVFQPMNASACAIDGVLLFETQPLE